ERADDGLPVHCHIDSADDEVERPGDFLQLGCVARIHHVMRAEFFCFLALRIAGGERMDFASPFVQKLKRQMPKPPDADDPDAIRRLRTKLYDRVEYGDAATK